MGLVDLETATVEEMKKEATEIINHIPSLKMMRYICSFLRVFYKRYDCVGYQMFLAGKNGETDVPMDELLRRSKEADE